MAQRLDAAGDYLRWTTNLPGSTALTACGWAVMRTDRNDYSCLFSVEDGAVSAATTLNLCTDSDGTSLKAYSPATVTFSSSVATLVPGTPFFWAIVLNGSGAGAITIYYAEAGATALSSVTHTGASFTPAAMFVGNDSYSEFWNGGIQAFKQWNAALTASELLQEMRTIRPQRTANLQRWIRGTAAADTVDYSGNGYNPTVGGTLGEDQGAPVSWGAPILVDSTPPAAVSYSLTADAGSYTLTGENAALNYGATAGTGCEAWFDESIDADAWFDADLQTAYWFSTEIPALTNIAAAGYSITAAQGSYALTGQAAALRASRRLIAAQGSYALNGQAAGLKKGHVIAAAQGSYSLTGQAVNLRAARQIAAAQGSYSLNGQAAALRASRLLVAGQGSYALNGQTAGLKKGHVIAAAQGSYSLTGQAANLRAARQIAAAQGSYSLTGQAATLRASRLLVAGQGSYSLNGQAAVLRLARRLAAGQGSYSLNGQALTLSYSGSGAKTIIASAGSYALAGQDVALRLARRITAAQGSYALTGQAAGLLRGLRLSAAPGNYALAGQPVTLRATRRLVADSGAYALSGIAASLLFVRRISLASGGYTLTGHATAFSRAYFISADQGSYTLDGQPITLDYSGAVAPPVLGPRPGGAQIATAGRVPDNAASRSQAVQPMRSPDATRTRSAALGGRRR